MIVNDLSSNGYNVFAMQPVGGVDTTHATAATRVGIPLLGWPPPTVIL